MTEHVLDARGLVCPLPVLRANKMLRGLAPGDQLAIQVTDPAAPADFARFCDSTGHVLLGTQPAEGDVVVIRLRKSG